MRMMMKMTKLKLLRLDRALPVAGEFAGPSCPFAARSAGR
jgi:hypothetical protein